MGEFKDGNTPVGIVKDVGRAKEEKFVCTFDTMDFERVDMTTMVVVGNKSTFIHDDLMITPRVILYDFSFRWNIRQLGDMRQNK